jgi:hypothetical protein
MRKGDREVASPTFVEHIARTKGVECRARPFDEESRGVCSFEPLESLFNSVRYPLSLKRSLPRLGFSMQQRMRQSLTLLVYLAGIKSGTSPSAALHILWYARHRFTLHAVPNLVCA